jgi:pyrroloquinoline quinone (PQQ) biosynthesis protein C
VSFDDRTTKPTDNQLAIPSIVGEISSWLAAPANRVDATLGPQRERINAEVRLLNERAAGNDRAALRGQQLLLSRIYQLCTQLPNGDSAEGSVIIHEVTRLLEQALVSTEDSLIDTGVLDGMPADGKAFVSWLKAMARRHRAAKHPYYVDFINNRATTDDLRRYIIQESAVDGRFDDLLAMMQVGARGSAKMEIAQNFWDEMGNGNSAEVHTHLFNKIYEVFDIGDEELESAATANDLRTGNLAVLLCRYRAMYGEAVGFLGMTEWLVPDRFRYVVRAWERLGLPDVGITYHRLHITVDSHHAAGWFHNVIIPGASSPAMRRGVARGALWRLNSSARQLDERLAASASAPVSSAV